eukprot:3935352-Rhodomonas_salina.2
MFKRVTGNETAGAANDGDLSVSESADLQHSALPRYLGSAAHGHPGGVFEQRAPTLAGDWRSIESCCAEKDMESDNTRTVLGHCVHNDATNDSRLADTTDTTPSTVVGVHGSETLQTKLASSAWNVKQIVIRGALHAVGKTCNLAGEHVQQQPKASHERRRRKKRGPPDKLHFDRPVSWTLKLRRFKLEPKMWNELRLQLAPELGASERG